MLEIISNLISTSKSNDQASAQESYTTASDSISANSSYFSSGCNINIGGMLSDAFSTIMSNGDDFEDEYDEDYDAHNLIGTEIIIRQERKFFGRRRSAKGQVNMIRVNSNVSSGVKRLKLKKGLK